MHHLKLLWPLCLSIVACESSKHPPVGEGDDERDLGVEWSSEEGSITLDEGADESIEEVDDDPPPVTDEPVDAPETDIEVCYPGADGTYSMCFPLVDHVDEMGAAYDYPDPYEGSEQYRAPVRYIDLDPVDHSLPLSPNFVVGEFMHRDKGQFGLYQVHAVESLQAIREATGGPVYANSGYRNVTYNEGVGGAEWSRHMYGDAMDMYSDTVSLDELADICEDMGAGFTKLYTSHVHCDWRDDPLDFAFFE